MKAFFVGINISVLALAVLITASSVVLVYDKPLINDVKAQWYHFNH